MYLLHQQSAIVVNLSLHCRIWSAFVSLTECGTGKILMQFNVKRVYITRPMSTLRRHSKAVGSVWHHSNFLVGILRDPDLFIMKNVFIVTKSRCRNKRKEIRWLLLFLVSECFALSLNSPWYEKYSMTACNACYNLHVFSEKAEKYDTRWAMQII